MAPAKKTVKIVQYASSARRHHDQRETLIGLKLNKIGRTSELPDTPSTHGMVKKLGHLVRIVDEAKK
ncbi:MAG: 50S ribosomal protein L30 [Pseudolabrys sp.]